MLCDVPSMAVSSEATAASVEVKSTLVAHVSVSQKCLHAPSTCRSTHGTCTTLQRAASVGGVLDAATDGASAAAAGRERAAKSPAARAVQVVELPQPAGGPRERTD